MSATTGTSPVTVEPLRWWHLPQVHAIEQALFPGDCWSIEQFWSELAQPTRRYLAALEDDEVVGYAGLFLLPPDADIQTVGVRADRQGRGVAGRLLDALLATADRAGATHTMLEVRADNAAAIALYDRLGFEAISERRRYYPDGGDAVIMRRPRPRHGGDSDAD
jgi:ribosomal-protein-alanine N-acetyltransferase